MSKNKFLTIPNLLSLFRILLIPIFVVVYVRQETIFSIWPISILILSGLTDLLDGWIARRFHQISDVGKVLDPAADKLTQVAVVAALTIRYHQLLVLLVIYVVKELLILIGGMVMIKSRQEVPSAKWFGKIATFEFYFAMALFLIFPNMNAFFITILIMITVALMLFSLVMYAVQFFSPKDKKGDNK